MQINALLTRKLYENDIKYLLDRLNPEVRFTIPDAFNEEDLLKFASDADVFVGPFFTERLLIASKHLKMVQVPWTGVDTVDFNLLRRFNVLLCNSHSSALAVAEYAVSLMLSAIKQIPYHDARLRQGNWCRTNEKGNDDFQPPNLVQGKNVLIWGLGAIGKQIAHLLGSFRVNIFAVDYAPTSDNELVSGEVYPESKALEALSKADIIFICLPLTTGTHSIVGKSAFSAMRRTAVLINTSRGEIVDEAALYLALKNNIIAGAAIDTWYNYPDRNKSTAFPSNHFPFHELNNLVLSPHRAGFINGQLPHLDDVAENLNRLASGQQPLNVVNKTKEF
jgi:phosphoglycerate dehydrogenase-like enzyme